MGPWIVWGARANFRFETGELGTLQHFLVLPYSMADGGGTRRLALLALAGAALALYVRDLASASAGGGGSAVAAAAAPAAEPAVDDAAGYAMPTVAAAAVDDLADFDVAAVAAEGGLSVRFLVCTS